MADNRNTNKRVNTEDLQAGQTQEFILPSDGDIDRGDFIDQFEIQDKPLSNDKAKNLAFMEEQVEVILNPGSQYDAQTVQTNVNGVNQFFIRGAKQWVKRKFIAVLAQAKTELIRTIEFTDNTGGKATRIQKTYVPTHPFTVLTDRNHDGHAWLERMMREA